MVMIHTIIIIITIISDVHASRHSRLLLFFSFLLDVGFLFSHTECRRRGDINFSQKKIYVSLISSSSFFPYDDASLNNHELILNADGELWRRDEGCCCCQMDMRMKRGRHTYILYVMVIWLSPLFMVPLLFICWFLFWWWWGYHFSFAAIHVMGADARVDVSCSYLWSSCLLYVYVFNL